jgi:hypothetical protein
MGRLTVEQLANSLKRKPDGALVLQVQSAAKKALKKHMEKEHLTPPR